MGITSLVNNMDNVVDINAVDMYMYMVVILLLICSLYAYSGGHNDLKRVLRVLRGISRMITACSLGTPISVI